MNFNDGFIILVCITVIVSGYYINFYKDKAKNDVIEKTENDKSLFIFRSLIPLALVLSLFFYFLEIAAIFFPSFVVYFGYFIVLFGLFFRWFAVMRLGKRFRVKVSLIEGQKLETTGIYRLIRHPSYTGLLLYYFGLGIVMQNYISLIILIVMPLYVVVTRVRVEEIFLCKHFGEKYTTYKSNTYRLIPYLY
jgi:protein-S-isoprenylcysteine O-methyltransferase Ste14